MFVVGVTVYPSSRIRSTGDMDCTIDSGTGASPGGTEIHTGIEALACAKAEAANHRLGWP